jgi:hypothetical protein
VEEQQGRLGQTQYLAQLPLLAVVLEVVKPLLVEAVVLVVVVADKTELVL